MPDLPVAALVMLDHCTPGYLQDAELPVALKLLLGEDAMLEHLQLELLDQLDEPGHILWHAACCSPAFAGDTAFSSAAWGTLPHASMLLLLLMLVHFILTTVLLIQKSHSSFVLVSGHSIYFVGAHPVSVNWKMW